MRTSHAGQGSNSSTLVTQTSLFKFASLCTSWTARELTAQPNHAAYLIAYNISHYRCGLYAHFPIQRNRVQILSQINVFRLVKHAKDSSVFRPTATTGSFPSFTSKLFALQSANQCPRLCPHYAQLAFHNMPFFHPKDNGDAVSVLRVTYVYAA